MYRSGSFLFLLIIFTLTACQKNFLDQVPDDRITIDQVFNRRDLSEQYLANIYNTAIKDPAGVTAGIPWIGCSDEGDVSYDRVDYNSFKINIGNWNALSNYYNFWQGYYQGVRSATYFISRIGKNEQILAEPNGAELVKQYTGEARFLRAYCYFLLLEQYGPVVIAGEDAIPVDLPISDPRLNLPRSSFDECVDYIVSELDKAATELPLHFTTQGELDYGRATKVACMAVKARLLLYAASPLFNGNKDYTNFKNTDGKQLINQSEDLNKWRRAADASKDIINEGLFSLYKKSDPIVSLRDVFLDTWNSEWLFARAKSSVSAWERTATPRGIAAGFSATGPTQKQVDAYEMENGMRPVTGYNADGSPVINTASGYKETGMSTVATKYTTVGTYNMYVGREPRFYVAVSYGGSYWINTSEGNKVIQTWFSGESGKKGSWDHSRTGYLNRKNVSPLSNPRLSKYTDRAYVMFRFGEVLLNYVEALNEVEPGHSDILLYLNMIRDRAGVPQYGQGANPLPVPNGQIAMREAIRHERQVELAFEYLRYFDTRRWKIAEQTESGPFYGMNVDADPPAFYRRTVFETRVFRKNYYLFPIPQSEIDIDRNIVQNPGW